MFGENKNNFFSQARLFCCKLAQNPSQHFKLISHWFEELATGPYYAYDHVCIT